jgi:hypothetical protein
MNPHIDQPELRELDHRSGDGFDVTLLWSSQTGKIFVAVEDARTNEAFHITVDPQDALEAFRHPYAYSRRDRMRRAHRDEAASLRPAHEFG